MLNRLFNNLGVVVVYLAASLFFAFLLLGLYLAFLWKVDADKLNLMLAVAQGYDIYQMQEDRRKAIEDTVQQITRDEILQIRAERGVQEDYQNMRTDQLEDSILAQIRVHEDDRKRLTEIAQNIDKKIADIEEERKSAGFADLVLNMQLLPPDLAKRQIVKMYDNDEYDRIVLIFRDMEEGPKKKILKVMREDEDVDKMADIFKRIGDGEPESRVAKEAREEINNLR